MKHAYIYVNMHEWLVTSRFSQFIQAAVRKEERDGWMDECGRMAGEDTLGFSRIKFVILSF